MIMHVYGEAFHRIDGTMKHVTLNKNHVAKAFDLFFKGNQEDLDAFLSIAYEHYHYNTHCCSALANLVWGNPDILACKKAFDAKCSFSVKTSDGIFGFGFSDIEARQQYTKVICCHTDN